MTLYGQNSTSGQKMDAGKNIFERVFVQNNPRKTCRTKIHGSVVPVTGELAALLAVIPVNKSDFVSLNFKGRNTTFSNGAAGIENAWNSDVIVKSAPETDFLALLVASIKLDFQRSNFPLDNGSFFTIC